MASFVVREVPLIAVHFVSLRGSRQAMLWWESALIGLLCFSHPLYRLCVSIAWMLGRVLRVWCLSYGCGHSGSWKKGHFHHIFSFCLVFRQVVVEVWCSTGDMLWPSWEKREAFSLSTALTLSLQCDYIWTALVSFSTQTKATQAVSVVLSNRSRDYAVERTEEEERAQEENPKRAGEPDARVAEDWQDSNWCSDCFSSFLLLIALYWNFHTGMAVLGCRLLVLALFCQSHGYAIENFRMKRCVIHIF